MAQHNIYAKNGRTVIQKVGESKKSIVRVSMEMDTVNDSVFLQNLDIKSQSWTVKYGEILDELGVQIDVTGTQEDVVTDYLTTVTAFSSASGGSGAIPFAQTFTATNVITSTTSLTPYSSTFTASGLDPAKQYEVSAYFTWWFPDITNYLHMNLLVNGATLRSNFSRIAPGTNNRDCASKIFNASPDANGDILLSAVFGISGGSFARVGSVHYKVQEVRQ